LGRKHIEVWEETKENVRVKEVGKTWFERNTREKGKRVGKGFRENQNLEKSRVRGDLINVHYFIRERKVKNGEGGE